MDNDDVLHPEEVEYSTQSKIGRASRAASQSSLPVSTSGTSISHNVISGRHLRDSMASPPFTTQPSFPAPQATMFREFVGDSFDSKALHGSGHSVPGRTLAESGRSQQNFGPKCLRLQAGEHNSSHKSSHAKYHPRTSAAAGNTLRSVERTSPQSSLLSLRSLNAQVEAFGNTTGFGNLSIAGKTARKKIPSLSGGKQKDTFGDARTEGLRVSSERQDEERQVASGKSKMKGMGWGAHAKQEQLAHSDADGILGWGWRSREKGDAWPAFRETERFFPLFDARGNLVSTTLRGYFNINRLQKGKVSSDGGELVHELQKRNIFEMREMSYTLDLPDDASSFLTLRYKDVPKKIQRFFIKLIGRGFCESKDSYETPLETRGKARGDGSTHPVHVKVEMRPHGSDDTLKCPGFTRSRGETPLPDVLSLNHLEFKHATPGNKTIGFWRLPKQHFYRLVLQLCADIGNPEELVTVAERSSELILVRGRPPGGREKAQQNPSPKAMENEKGSQKGSTGVPPNKKQKQRRRLTKEDDKEEEEDWADGLPLSPVTRDSLAQVKGGSAAEDSQCQIGREPTARYHNTRKRSKRAFAETNLEDDDGEHSGDESGDDDRDGDYHEEEREEESEENGRDGEYDEEEAEEGPEEEFEKEAQSGPTDESWHEPEISEIREPEDAPYEQEEASDQGSEGQSEVSYDPSRDIALSYEEVLELMEEEGPSPLFSQEHQHPIAQTLDFGGPQHPSTVGGMPAQLQTSSNDMGAADQSYQKFFGQVQGAQTFCVAGAETTVDASPPADSESDLRTSGPSSAGNEPYFRFIGPMLDVPFVGMTSSIDPTLLQDDGPSLDLDEFLKRFN